MQTFAALRTQPSANPPPCAAAIAGQGESGVVETPLAVLLHLARQDGHDQLVEAVRERGRRDPPGEQRERLLQLEDVGPAGDDLLRLSNHLEQPRVVLGHAAQVLADEIDDVAYEGRDHLAIGLAVDESVGAVDVRATPPERGNHLARSQQAHVAFLDGAGRDGAVAKGAAQPGIRGVAVGTDGPQPRGRGPVAQPRRQVTGLRVRHPPDLVDAQLLPDLQERLRVSQCLCLVELCRDGRGDGLDRDLQRRDDRAHRRDDAYGGAEARDPP